MARLVGARRWPSATAAVVVLAAAGCQQGSDGPAAPTSSRPSSAVSVLARLRPPGAPPRSLTWRGRPLAAVLAASLPQAAGNLRQLSLNDAGLLALFAAPSSQNADLGADLFAGAPRALARLTPALRLEQVYAAPAGGFLSTFSAAGPLIAFKQSRAEPGACPSPDCLSWQVATVDPQGRPHVVDTSPAAGSQFGQPQPLVVPDEVVYRRPKGTGGADLVAYDPSRHASTTLFSGDIDDAPLRSAASDVLFSAGTGPRRRLLRVPVDGTAAARPATPARGTQIDGLADGTVSWADGDPTRGMRLLVARPGGRARQVFTNREIYAYRWMGTTGIVVYASDGLWLVDTSPAGADPPLLLTDQPDAPAFFTTTAQCVAYATRNQGQQLIAERCLR